MQTYESRLRDLFESGSATSAQWDELIEAVMTAAEVDYSKLDAIHEGMGHKIGDGL